jgi:predicted nucleotidyltransferase component of viral defense system
LKYSREYLDRLAGATGYPPDTLEKVLRLERMLTLVGEHHFLGPRLILKGGTALNLFYQQAPRLSVDLDFNYIVMGDVVSEVDLRSPSQRGRCGSSQNGGPGRFFGVKVNPSSRRPCVAQWVV